VDLERLATRHDVDLMLLSVSSTVLTAPVVEVLETAPCDVALVSTRSRVHEGPVVVPFGAHENDWAALELAAWFASARGAPMTLVGSRSSTDAERDASRLLADASLLVQSFVRVTPEIRLIPPGAPGLLGEAEAASLLVVGLADAWRQGHLGETRATLVRDSHSPVVLVRRGTRPGGLAPRDTTLFAWSLTSLGRT
jgi:hypothetical protein